MDFAYPAIGIDLESDGTIWHSDEESKQRDAERDKKLASLGWRVIRFTEDAINQHIDKVAQIIMENIKEATAEKMSAQKKKGSSNELSKYSKYDTRYSTFDKSAEMQITLGIEDDSENIQPVQDKEEPE
jgi:hypothetical protein